jgi:flavin reductase (DIM6/NTAB) family NADH-FMN oxidoreductase RutF
MSQQSLSDQWENMGDMGAVEWHTATQVAGDERSGWTAEWVLQVLFTPHRVRASYQEEKALRSFEQTRREGTR